MVSTEKRLVKERGEEGEGAKNLVINMLSTYGTHNSVNFALVFCFACVESYGYIEKFADGFGDHIPECCEWSACRICLGLPTDCQRLPTAIQLSNLAVLIGPQLLASPCA